MKTLTQTLLASSLATALLLAPAWAETPAVTEDNAALSDVPPPQGLDTHPDTQLQQAAGATPYAPAESAPVQENDAPADAASSADPTPPIVLPEVAPADTPSATLNQPISSTVSVAQMGQKQGITLTGGQLQSGIVFTLPADEVITNARLNLSLRVSAALAAKPKVTLAGVMRCASINGRGKLRRLVPIFSCCPSRLSVVFGRIVT